GSDRRQDRPSPARVRRPVHLDERQPPGRRLRVRRPHRSEGRQGRRLARDDRTRASVAGPGPTRMVSGRGSWSTGLEMPQSLREVIGVMAGLVLCQACGASAVKDVDGGAAAQGDPPPAGDWREAMAAFAGGKAASAAFALEFYGPAPGNSGLQIRQVLGLAGDTCANFERYDATGTLNPHDYWLLQIEVGVSAPGDYPVVADLSPNGPNPIPAASAS